MENIIQTPGLHHIIEKTIACLDRKSITEFRLVNQDCKRITDCPRFYFKKLSQDTFSLDLKLIEIWRPIVQNISVDNEDIKQSLAMELFKMYLERRAIPPLTLAQDLAFVGKEEKDWRGEFEAGRRQRVNQGRMEDSN